MSTVTLFQPDRVARFCLVAILATGCAPMRAVEPVAAPKESGAAPSASAAPAVAPASAKPTEPLRPIILTPPLRPTRKLIIIEARVDSRRRIVSGEKSSPALGSDVEALARELAPQGMLARGTQIDAVYETRDGSTSRASNRRLVAVRVGSGSSARVAVVLAEEGNVHARAYSLDGRPVGTDLLRYPVAHLRITSGFSYSRKHPISKKRKPHLAVDFAASFGTPVVAVADGKVVQAKWEGGFGRIVRIEHDADYASAYAHLQRYATGIKAGAQVRKGQVIGYVGNSGVATGPHLHFALFRAGTPIDPLGSALPTPPRLVGEALIALHGESTQVEHILAAADREHATTRVASAHR